MDDKTETAPHDVATELHGQFADLLPPEMRPVVLHFLKIAYMRGETAGMDAAAKVVRGAAHDATP